jgi:hypothetical protein
MRFLQSIYLESLPDRRSRLRRYFSCHLILPQGLVLIRGADVFFHSGTCREIEIRPVPGEHAFAKKTQQTPPADIKLARKRLKEMLDEK